MLAYTGSTGRCYRLTGETGRKLAHGSTADVPAEEISRLLAVGVVVSTPQRWVPSLNRLTPAAAGSRYIIGLLWTCNAGAWCWVIWHWTAISQDVYPLLSQWSTWVWWPLMAFGLTIAHEWGHVLAMRALGGRAGRLLLRWGWPWAVTEVGPFQVLSRIRTLVLIGSGMAVEAGVLGVCLGVLSSAPTAAPVAALAATSAIHLSFNLIPLPFSDTYHLLRLLLRTPAVSHTWEGK